MLAKESRANKKGAGFPNVSFVVDGTTAMPYSSGMRVIHTTIYLRRVKKLFDAAQLAHVDQMLRESPEAGAVIAGTGGLRKLRIAFSGRGKRGGARVIYYYWQEGQSVYLFTAYAKNDQSDLTHADKRAFLEIITWIKRGTYEKIIH